MDRCTIQLPNGSWEWRYRGRYLNGSLSGFITESECLDSFSSLQLDVFHDLWELYQPPRHPPRSAAKSTSSERLAANRTHALLEVPIGAVVWWDFTDRQGRIKQRCRTEVYDYKTPYWRVRHADGDWKELTLTEIDAVSLPFRIHRLKVLLEAGLVAFSSACFEFADEVPKEAQHGSLAHLPKIFSSHLHGLSKVAVMGFCQ